MNSIAKNKLNEIMKRELIKNPGLTVKEFCTILMEMV